MENQSVLKCLKCGGQLYKVTFKAYTTMVFKQEKIWLNEDKLIKLNHILLENKSEIWDCPNCNRVYLKQDNQPIKERFREMRDIFNHFDLN